MLKKTTVLLNMSIVDQQSFFVVDFFFNNGDVILDYF